ncbi:hypothetical protein CIB84_011805 [Bambusicola thoracicus]|uniref:Uncharacterized protein n=1 Tax=Bambusicola thoracicus TaxID=9083 RepID=A0A2P4SK12_BAMTH|nr:hypothetical protein CIB84_011805 [Bambusicola thoracicus]
MAMGWWCSV